MNMSFADIQRGVFILGTCRCELLASYWLRWKWTSDQTQCAESICL